MALTPEVFVAIAVIFGATALYTFYRIHRAPLSDVQKMLWQLVVFLLPMAGFVAWYAYEFGILRASARQR